MTPDMQIPEAAVLAADRAGKEFAETHTMSMFASVADMQRECTRRMVQAAFAEALVPVAYYCPHDPDSASAFSWNAGACVEGGHPPLLRTPLYTIKETP